MPIDEELDGEEGSGALKGFMEDACASDDRWFDKLMESLIEPVKNVVAWPHAGQTPWPAKAEWEDFGASQ